MTVAEALAEIITSLNAAPVRLDGIARDMVMAQMKLPPQMLELPVGPIPETTNERDRLLALMEVGMAAVRAELARMEAVR